MAYQKSKFVYFCNRVYFSVYYLVTTFNKCLTFWVPKRKKYKGEDMDVFFNNPDYGFFMYYVNYAMCGILLGIMLLSIPILQIILGIKFRDIWMKNMVFVFIAFGGISMLFSHIVLWRKNLYLKYFRLFEKETRRSKVKWNVLTFISYVALYVLLFLLYVLAEKSTGTFKW